MADLVQLLNRGMPAAEINGRRRLWLCIGNALALGLGVSLRALRERDGDSDRLFLEFHSADGTRRLDCERSFRVDDLYVVPRALRETAAGRPFAVLLECSGAVDHVQREAAA